MRQFKPDESDLDHLRQDVLRLSKIESMMLTDGGKEFLSLLEERKRLALQDYAGKDLSTMNEAMVIAFPYITRGKLQILMDLIRYLENTSIERERIMRELAQYDNPSKGDK
jgi:hypothetical protein